VPIKNGKLILQREVSDMSERFTVDPANLLSIGTVVALASSGSYEIVTSVGSSDIRTIGVVYSLDRTGNPFIALSGRCIVNVRGSVGKGDLLVLSSYNGMLVSNNSASRQDVMAKALTTNSLQHGQVECVFMGM
tara:strand:+ start:236 stop:637 length:402 start_codon:yes stop_codon:yes gene_type:complete